jgi:hypothetical protein
LTEGNETVEKIGADGGEALFLAHDMASEEQWQRVREAGNVTRTPSIAINGATGLRRDHGERPRSVGPGPMISIVLVMVGRNGASSDL